MCFRRHQILNFKKNPFKIPDLYFFLNKNSYCLIQRIERNHVLSEPSAFLFHLIWFVFISFQVKFLLNGKCQLKTCASKFRELIYV